MSCEGEGLAGDAKFPVVVITPSKVKLCPALDPKTGPLSEYFVTSGFSFLYEICGTSAVTLDAWPAAQATLLWTLGLPRDLVCSRAARAYTMFS